MVPFCYLFLLSVFILWFTSYVSDIYSEAIKSIQFLVLNTGSHVNGCVKNISIVKRLVLQNTNSNCFAVINNGVMVLNSNSVVPIKTRFAHHKRLARMSVSKTTSLFNQKLPANGFKLN